MDESNGRPGAGSPKEPRLHNEFKQQEMLRYLITGSTARQTAEQLGVSQWTIYNWLKQPQLREQMKELKSGLLEKLDLEMEEKFKTKQEIVDELVMTSLRELQSLTTDTSIAPAIRVKLLNDNIDRDPSLARSRKVDVTERKVNLTGEDLRHALNSMKEIEDREREKAAREVKAELIESEPFKPGE